MKMYSVLVIVLLSLPHLSVPQNPAGSSQTTDLRPVLIRMERTQCYGPCPIYSVVITGDGKVIYEGKKFVKVKGQRVLRIKPEKVRALVEAFFQIDYFSLRESYDYLEQGNGIRTMVTDLPTTITSIQVAGRSKTVSNYLGAPAALGALEKKIDETAGITKFIKKRKERLE
jgi:Domain of unknown function (DUF6438)